MMFYLRRFAESMIISIVCSVPAYLRLIGEMSDHTLEEGRLQLVFFCIFLVVNFLIQNAVYRYDRRWKYYIALSVLGYLPYTLLNIACYFILPINIYNLFFMPMVFFEWMGASYLVSVIIANVTLYLLALVTPTLRHLLKKH